ncbi:hypothetical protein C8A01DRAFT_37796 [Parachaetomium inaequale]|uniref:F-box domain-containing protein n=1 Tax=Parachaetomium inaequale TaxID=2588326 RepID=A0AAN6PG11_9PEZI|nr:hypothetical protein C8A01DRAFT_37796 [Parachaetomium inaequale]
MSLVRLPYELVAYVVQDLDLADICSLSYTCKKFQFLVQEAKITKRLLESRAPHSAEARDARVSKDYAAGLRRLIKRREAIAAVSPYLVATVAFAQEWLYENGVLCYCRGRELRILDLHHSAASEIVVDLRKLVQEALPETRARHKYKLTLLYYSHNIVSCVYSQVRYDQPGCEDFLLVFNPLDGQIFIAARVESISRLFVRNNDRFLYCGITTEPDDQGAEYWDIRGFDITACRWLDGRLRVPDVLGTDVGSTICFEIFDGYFYGLSNLRSLDVIVVDWVSYYSCFRFPLAKNGFRDVEVLDPCRQLWRRDHTEGPIDDRWTLLRFFKDETTGQLKVLESRSEWLEGRITARRTYYTTPISFDRPANHGTGSDISATKTQQGATPRRWPRDLHMVHPGDGSSTITPTKCPLRSYSAACQTFIDLVDDSSSPDPRDQRLRIRGGTRRPWTPGELAQLSAPAAVAKKGEQDHEALLRQIDALYRNETGLYWPPSQNPSSAADPALADLYAVLNPPGHVGNPHGSWDERSMVYATGGGAAAGGLKALVFVSWDPSIHLSGTAAYPGDLGVGRPGGWARSSSLARPAAKASAGEKGKGGDTPERHSTLQPDATSDPGSPGSNTPVGGGNGGKQVSWRTLQPARYREISRGYHFAL